ncbi:pleiotropic drug resistance protein 3-like [Senna tora]|uniref:Pleiotropic drug resistance protein 3-like n=1 Tax=Senna tora TaxID=362788 RepID=A0A834T9X4_9FABA|nr:pleiotropic drug resistance protein 3-like [Senna tora]
MPTFDHDPEKPIAHYNKNIVLWLREKAYDDPAMDPGHKWAQILPPIYLPTSDSNQNEVERLRVRMLRELTDHVESQNAFYKYHFDGHLYWISLGALFGFTFVFIVGLVVALSFLNCSTVHSLILEFFTSVMNLASGSSRAIISSKKLAEIQASKMVIPFTPYSGVSRSSILRGYTFDPDGDACLDSAIWTSCTISSDRTWQPPSELGV